MRCTLPPAAGTLSEAGGPRGPKQSGGRFLPRRRAGGGVVGGEKYSSLELDATAAAGDTGDPGSGDGEAELSDDTGGGGRARLEAALVNISSFLYLGILTLNIIFHFGFDVVIDMGRHSCNFD